MNTISFSEAIDEYFAVKRAERYSEHTLLDYRNTFTKFQRFLGTDLPLSEITARDITAFMGSTTNVSKKTALNYHTGLSSLWNWAVQTGYCAQNIVRVVKPPRPETRTIIPYSRSEIRLLIEAAEAGWLPKRDVAIILTLLDTGARASELCALKVMDININTRRLRVLGKGSKERQLKFCARTQEAIMDYLQERGVGVTPKYFQTPLFATQTGRETNRYMLQDLMERLEIRSGVYPAYSHRFRHTFAINFLRNGGNVYTLQDLLGHSSLDMVKIYVQIAQLDIDRDHELASPVKRWEL